MVSGMVLRDFLINITSGKNFIKITSVGMGAPKSNETRYGNKWLQWRCLNSDYLIFSLYTRPHALMIAVQAKFMSW